MFCPKCGSKEVVDIFCKNCLKEERPLVQSFKPFEAEVCSGCAKIRFRGKVHQSENVAESLSALFVDQVVASPSASIERVAISLPEIDLKDGLKVTGEAAVQIWGSASKETKAYLEEYVVPFAVQNRHCRRCSKEGTQYFEGVLQVRNETPERRAFFLEFLRQHKSGVAKEEKERRGTDYYLASKAMIEKGAHALQERFGGIIKGSARLFGHDKQRSKDVYRLTWFVEMPLFETGEIVLGTKGPLFVVELGKRIKFYSPARGKYEFHEYKDAQFTAIPRFETTISAAEPEVTVIHPETFQESKVWNAKLETHHPGERVNVCMVDGKLYIHEIVL